jgi:phage shock protein PspC (stress-responsive transcriptional regulator)
MKKLYRSKSDKMLAGICGGLGSYLNIDPTIIRLIMIVLCIFTVIIPLLIVYFIAALIIPLEKKDTPLNKNYTKFYRSIRDRKIAGICGGIGAVTKIDPVFLRLLMIFLCVITGIIPLVLAYFIGWMIIPEYPSNKDIEV